MTDWKILLSISSLEIALLSVGTVALVAVTVWYWARSLRLARFVNRYEKERDYAEELPSVTVVVSAYDYSDCLQQFLPAVLEQDYPAPFEVVAVVRNSCDIAGNQLAQMVAQYSNLRVTFVPDDTRALSRRKLSIMLGIKAAKHDVILTTGANCSPSSDQWLRLMMRNFTPTTDVVIGYSHILADSDRRWGSRVRTFDRVTRSLQYLIAAIKNQPYRGDGHNLAYRKSTFFANNGFASSLDLQWGDDDVFVHEIARPDNTRVELAPEAMMTVVYPDPAWSHRRNKERREFTAHMLPQKAFIMQGIMSALGYVGLASMAAAVATGYQHPLTIAIAAVVAIACAIAVMPAVGRSCQLLGARRLRFSAPWLVLWRPIVNLGYRLRSAATSKSNYTSMYN